jgi:hypothetical protein
MDPTKKAEFLLYSRNHALWDLYPDGEAAIAGNYGWQYKYTTSRIVRMRAT